MYRIQNGIEIPPKGKSTGRPNGLAECYNKMYPWADMKKGQSFFVPIGAMDTPYDIQNRVRSNATQRSRYSEAYITRIIRSSNGMATGVRVWRTK